MMRLVVASGLVHRVVGAAICAIGFATVAQGQGIGPRPNPREWSSGGPISPEQAAYDVTFYDLGLRVSPADSTIAGSLTVYARVIAPLSSTSKPSVRCLPV